MGGPTWNFGGGLTYPCHGTAWVQYNFVKEWLIGLFVHNFVTQVFFQLFSTPASQSLNGEMERKFSISLDKDKITKMVMK